MHPAFAEEWLRQHLRVWKHCLFLTVQLCPYEPSCFPSHYSCECLGVCFCVSFVLFVSEQSPLFFYITESVDAEGSWVWPRLTLSLCFIPQRKAGLCFCHQTDDHRPPDFAVLSVGSYETAWVQFYFPTKTPHWDCGNIISASAISLQWLSHWKAHANNSRNKWVAAHIPWAFATRSSSIFSDHV